MLNPRFIEVYTDRQAPDEVWSVQRPKRWDNKDKNEDNNPHANNVNNDLILIQEIQSIFHEP